MKKRIKGKENLKVVAVSALALGLSSAAFIGINNLALAQATGATPLTVFESEPIVPTSTANTSQVPDQDLTMQDAVFVPPKVTFVTSIPLEIPSHAMPKEEALQIGAQYIWDVFDASIDGMYVYMSYQMLPGFTRPFWLGTVFSTTPTHLKLDFEDFVDDLGAWGEAQVFPLYHFRLDAITGMRIGVTYSAPSDLESSRIAFRESNQEESAVLRPVDPLSPEMIFMSEWFEMSAEEQLKLSDITSERFEAYMQTALVLAQRHFNLTTVQDIELGGSFQGHVQMLERLEDDGTGGIVGIIGGLVFTTNDSTGREAIIRIPTANSSWRFTSVETMYNEFIPGFSYNRPGLG